MTDDKRNLHLLCKRQKALSSADILPGDRFLMCSDGMYTYLEEEETPRVLAEGEIDDD